MNIMQRLVKSYAYIFRELTDFVFSALQELEERVDCKVILVAIGMLVVILTAAVHAAAVAALLFEDVEVGRDAVVGHWFMLQQIVQILPLGK